MGGGGIEHGGEFGSVIIIGILYSLWIAISSCVELPEITPEDLKANEAENV